MASLRDLGAITPLPLPFVLLLSLPLASVAATALLPAFAVTRLARQLVDARRASRLLDVRRLRRGVHDVSQLLEASRDPVLKPVKIRR